MKPSLSRLLAQCAAVALIPLAGTAMAQSAFVINNAFVQAANGGGSTSGSNYGSSTSMILKNNTASGVNERISYLGFNLSTASPFAAGSTLNLLVTGNNNGTAIGSGGVPETFPVQIWGLTATNPTWTTNSITFANAPGSPTYTSGSTWSLTGATLIDTVNVPANATQPYVVSLSSPALLTFMNANLGAGGDTNVTLILQRADSNLGYNLTFATSNYCTQGTGYTPNFGPSTAPFGPAPTVTGVGPASGSTAGGTTVTVTGTNFSACSSGIAVNFGGTPGTNVTVTSPTTLTVTSPAGAVGPVDVTVVMPGGTSATSAADTFTYVAPAPAPTLTGVSPSGGVTAGGASITLTGTGFTGATGVTVGGATCTNVVVVSDTSITCSTPAGTAGTASVVVTGPGGTNAANSLFTYFVPVNSIPTLSQYALASLGLLLAALAWAKRRSGANGN